MFDCLLPHLPPDELSDLNLTLYLVAPIDKVLLLRELLLLTSNLNDAVISLRVASKSSQGSCGLLFCILAVCTQQVDQRRDSSSLHEKGTILVVLN